MRNGHIARTWMRTRWLNSGIAVALGLAFTPATQADETPPVRQEMFLVPLAPVQAGDPSDTTVVRARPMFVNTAPLADAQAGRRELLPLFPDVTVVAGFDEIHRDPANDCTVVQGHLEGHANGEFSMAVVGGAMTGIVRAPDLGTFRFRSNPDGTTQITEIDPAQFAGCAQQIAPDIDPAPPAQALPDGCDNGATIDVMIMYTALARAAAGGTAAMEAECVLAIQAANTAYGNSGITPRLRLVHTEETSYPETGTYSDHLSRLTNNGDGYIDNAHTLRDTHGADMVALFVADTEYCGLAWIMSSNSAAFAPYAFSVTTWTCASGNLSFPHELGHNMGCCHDHANCGGGLYSYSYGHRFTGDSTTQFRTVMAYSPGARISQFSNPGVNYDGQPTGIAATLPGEADNAQTINQTAPTIALFRCSVVQPPAIGSLTVDVNPIDQGNTITLTANSVTAPSTTIDDVNFFRDSNGNSSLDVGDVQVGSDSSSAGGWTWTGSTSGFPIGTYLLFARATDDTGGWSNVVTRMLTVNPPPPPGVYIGPANGDWFTPANWSGGSVPGGGTTVYIDTAVNITSAGAQSADLNIQANGVVLLSGTATLSSTDVTIGANGAIIATAGSIGANSFTVRDGAILSMLGPTATIVAPVTVDDGGQLLGIGTLDQDVTNSGTIAPGIPYGTLYVNGTYDQLASGRLASEISTALLVGKLDVAGAVTLDGRLDVTWDDPAPAPGCFDVVGGASVSGAFDVAVVPHVNFNSTAGVNVTATSAQACLNALSTPGVLGQSGGDWLGHAVANAGDTDGDGVDDVVLGSPLNDANGDSAGKVSVYSGATGALLYTRFGPSGSRFGWSVAGCGDVNADGRDDFVVGAPFYSNQRGRIYVYSGMDGTRLYYKTGQSGSANRFGNSVGGGVDVNNDGYDDVLVGAPYYNSKRGRVLVYSGAAGGTLGTLTGAAGGDRFGWSVAAVGKVNSDANGDFIVGAPYNDDRASNAGKAYVYSGKTMSVIHAVKGRRAGDQFGYAVCGAGRINSDGRDDFIVGAPRYDKLSTSENDVGRVEVFSGSTGGLIFARTGDSADDRFGTSVCGAGDVNDDGRDDYALGAPRHDAGGTDAGRVEVRSGIDNATILTLDGPASGVNYGTSVAGLGDIDGDGCDDLLIGAPNESSFASAAGRVFVREVPCHPPTLDGLTVSADPLVLGQSVTLTAVNPTDNSSVDQVDFYHDTNGDGSLDGGDALFGTDPSSAGGWTATGATNFTLGTNRFFAVATDDESYTSNVVGATVTLTPPGEYVGPANGNWSVGANWADGNAPGPGTDVYIASAVTINAGGAQAADVVVTAGGDLTMTGVGTLTATSVTVEDGGTLSMGAVGVDLVSVVTIAEGGVLTGIGTITGDLISSGRIEPGLPAGTLTVSNDFTQLAPGTLAADINTAVLFDKIDAGGNAVLAGRLDVTFADPAPAAGLCFAVTAGATLTGTFNVAAVPHVDFNSTPGLTTTGTEARVCLSIMLEPGVRGTMAGDWLGHSVANVGDVDGDGKNDIAIGAPLNDANGDSAGKVSVYSSVSGELLYTNYGPSGSRYGWSVAGCGDVNGDGRGDWVVGAPFYSNQRGRIYVYSGMDGSRLFYKTGQSGKKNRFGNCVGGGVDVNNDGFDDVIVGSPYYSSKRGRVFVYSGPSGGVLATLTGESGGDRFGWSVAGVGRVNSDANGDFIVGAPYNDARASNAGKAYVYSGKTMTVIHGVRGRRANDRFGHAVGGAGRINSDGRADFIVGAPYYDKLSTNESDVGRSEVFSGNTGGLLFARTGDAPNDRFGWAVGAAGDANNDGRDDYFVAAPRHDFAQTDGGMVEIRSGLNNALIDGIVGTTAGINMGTSAAALGDLDGDGCVDFVVGAPYDSTLVSSAGRVVVVEVPCGGPDPSGDAVETAGDAASDAAGDDPALILGILAAWGSCTSDCPEDLNGDGYVDDGDLIIALGGGGGPVMTTSVDDATETTTDTPVDESALPNVFINADVLVRGDLADDWTVASDYAQTAEAMLMLTLDAGGSPASWLDVDGTAWLDGVLHVTGAEDLAPVAGDVFLVVDADAIEGAFFEVVFEGSLATVECTIVYDAGRVLIEVMATE